MPKTLVADNGSRYEIHRILPRPGGAVDLIVAYLRWGVGGVRFSAYRHEPDGAWKCLNGAWSDLEQAIRDVPRVQGYAPLVAPRLLRFLSAAIGIDVPVPVGEGPELPEHVEAEYRKEKGT